MPNFDGNNFFTDVQVKYSFNYILKVTTEDVLLGKTDNIYMKKGLNVFRGAGLCAVQK